MSHADTKIALARELAFEWVSQNPGGTLRDLLDHLGCQCGRPEKPEISAALMKMLARNEMTLDHERRVFLA